MSVAQHRSKNSSVFWVTAIVVVAAVTATLLLANDRRNLRMVAGHFGLSWFNAKERAPPLAVVARPAVKLVRAEPRVPGTFFKDPSSAPGSFVRTWRPSGEALCAKIAAAGLPVGSWQPATTWGGVFQCSNIPAAGYDDASDEPSLFVTIRGNSSRRVSDIRIKAVIPFNPAGMAVRDRFLAVVSTLIEQSGWLDLKNSFASVSRLENVAQPAFGAKLTFFHQYNNIRHCTLLLDLQNQTPEQRLAMNYFEKAKWLPLPAADVVR
jgi:hypothetical protein